jgi:hypothetical protein
MANRFPLIIDTADGNKIKELPIGDNLNLENSGIINLSSLNVAGAFSSGSLSIGSTLSVTTNTSIGGTLAVNGTSTLTGNVNAGGNVVVTGNVSAATITLAGSSLQLPVQSDWTETNNTSLAFIRNKPSSFAPDSLDDIGDVFVSDAVVGDVLSYDGVSWQASPPAGGIALTDLSVTTNTASGSGSLLYNNSTGVFTFTPPVVPTAVSQLTNDSGYTTLAIVESQNYLQTGDVLSSGRITRSVASNQVTLGFSDTGLLTTVSVSGNISGNGTGASPIVLNDNISLGIINATSTSTASTFKDVTLDNLTFGVGLNTTNGTITSTNGNITATNGTITGANLVATTALSTASILNTSGSITLTPNTSVILAAPVTVNQGLTFANFIPGSPTPGTIWSNTFAVYFRSTDNGEGGGVDKTFVLGGPGTGVAGQPGMIIPQFETADAPASPTTGEMYFDLGTSVARMWDGSTWRNLW